MSLYIKRFKYLLEQDEDPISPEEINAEREQAALKNNIDPETDPEDLGAKGTDGGIRSKYMSRFQEMIERFEEFAAYLNSDEEDSVNKFLNAVDKDGSIFSGVSRETGKVTTVAESLAALSESFKGYLLTGQRKLRDQEAALAEF